jgi:hypothetical protein
MQEDEKQRINRELIELLNELRVLLPGVQMLFAFMLILPFTGAFRETSELQRLVYFGAFLCATAATGLLIAPSAYHRLLFRQGDKERLLWVGNRLAIVGTAFLGLAMAGVIFVVTNVLFSVAWAAAVAAVSAAWLAWLWFGLALWRRLENSEAGRADGPAPEWAPRPTQALSGVRGWERSGWSRATSEGGNDMIGKVGDWIVVESLHVGGEPRKGKILEVLPSESGHPHYRVRWQDGHETVFAPVMGSARIVPAEEVVQA